MTLQAVAKQIIAGPGTSPRRAEAGPAEPPLIVLEHPRREAKTRVRVRRNPAYLRCSPIEPRR
jgi:hypothetical protein